MLTLANSTTVPTRVVVSNAEFGDLLLSLAQLYEVSRQRIPAGDALLFQNAALVQRVLTQLENVVDWSTTHGAWSQGFDAGYAAGLAAAKQ